MKSLGIYIHWPWCKTICPYCDFNVKKFEEIDTDTWLKAYIKEIKNLIYENPIFKIDVLINNAGGIFFKKQFSCENIEKTFALNHMGYFCLTHFLLEKKLINSGGKIINVASGAHWGVDLDFTNLQMRRGYNGWLAYKKSKLPSEIKTYTYLFLDDIIEQSGKPKEWPSTSYSLYFGMDPEIVGNTPDEKKKSEIKEALLDLPSISIATEFENLFGKNLYFLKIF